MKKIILLLVLMSSVQAFAQQHNCSGIMTFLGLEAQQSCNFDTLCPMTQIDTSNHNNIWQNGTPGKTYFTSAHSLPKAMVTDSMNPYPINNDSYFTLEFPLNMFPGLFMSNTCISFWHKMNTDTLHDGGIIEVKYNSDSAWKNIAVDTIPYASFTWFNCENLYGIQDTLFNGAQGFSGKFGWMKTQLQWVWMLPVKDYAYPDTLWMRFRFISDGVQTNKDGWMIDDLDINAYDPGSGFDELAMDRIVSVSPNPVHESALVTLKMQGNEPFTAELYDILGQKVKDYPDIITQSFTIERGNLNSGMYYLLLKNGRKFVAGHKIIFH
ncbi:MAG: T9SS type A sorting domain-containing protein [Bacteroidota bacterium]